MGNNISSKRIKNHYHGSERNHLCCKVCSKQLLDEYFEVTSKKPVGKFNVCSNDCEAVIWRILGLPSKSRSFGEKKIILEGFRKMKKINNTLTGKERRVIIYHLFQDIDIIKSHINDEWKEIKIERKIIKELKKSRVDKIFLKKYLDCFEFPPIDKKIRKMLGLSHPAKALCRCCKKPVYHLKPEKRYLILHDKGLGLIFCSKKCLREFVKGL